MKPNGAVKLWIVPTTIKEACTFVEQHHQHHRPPQGGIVALAASDGARIVAVAIVGRPVSRRLQDGFTAEVTRLATLREGPAGGPPNACSLLYAASWRAVRALGYHRLVTYTLGEETGASLRGAGWRLIGKAGGGSWSCPSRPRVDMHPLQEKLRWEAGSEAPLKQDASGARAASR